MVRLRIHSEEDEDSSHLYRLKSPSKPVTAEQRAATLSGTSTPTKQRVLRRVENNSVLLSKLSILSSSADTPSKRLRKQLSIASLSARRNVRILETEIKPGSTAGRTTSRRRRVIDSDTEPEDVQLDNTIAKLLPRSIALREPQVAESTTKVIEPVQEVYQETSNEHAASKLCESQQLQENEVVELEESIEEVSRPTTASGEDIGAILSL